MEFNVETIGAILFALLVFAKAITRLTPTEKDDKFVAFIEKALNLFLPDLKKGGGTHK